LRRRSTAGAGWLRARRQTTARVGTILDVDEARLAEVALIFVAGQRAGDAAGPCLHVGGGGIVDVPIGDDLVHGSGGAGHVGELFFSDSGPVLV
jgi:hypothetical protein